jgi:hypothetical protein
VPAIESGPLKRLLLSRLGWVGCLRCVGLSQEQWKKGGSENYMNEKRLLKELRKLRKTTKKYMNERRLPPDAKKWLS